jgi:hypothetical protein
LLFESDIRVPGYCVGALCQEIGAGAIIGASEDEMDFWEALGGT